MIRIAVMITVVVLGFLEAKPTWHKIVVDPQINFRAVDFVDYENGWACARQRDSTIVVTTNDGGRTWVQKYSRPNCHFGDIDFCDTLNGWVVGTRSDGGMPCLAFQIITSDGGNTWSQAKTCGGLYSSWINSCRLLKAGCGWGCGGDAYYGDRNGFVFPFGGRGIPFSFTDFYDVDGVDSLNWWAVGCTLRPIERGWAIHTSNGGITWQKQIGSFDSLPRIRIVDFVNHNFGIAIGDSGLILKTTNGGASWRKRFLNVIVGRMAMVDTLQGWIVGARGTILHTTNGSDTWFNDSSGTTVNLTGVSFVDSTHGWAVGDSGVVLIYCDSLTEIEERNDPRCSMHDARLKIRPNPFRGRTTITFDGADQAISGSVGGVSGPQQSVLRIYDATGRLVKSFDVTSHVLHPTSFVSWDGSDDQGAALPAGVYFVQVRSGNLSHTARVVLID